MAVGARQAVPLLYEEGLLVGEGAQLDAEEVTSERSAAEVDVDEELGVADVSELEVGGGGPVGGEDAEPRGLLAADEGPVKADGGDEGAVGGEGVAGEGEDDGFCVGRDCPAVRDCPVMVRRTGRDAPTHRERPYGFEEIDAAESEGRGLEGRLSRAAGENAGETRGREEGRSPVHGTPAQFALPGVIADRVS